MQWPIVTIEGFQPLFQTGAMYTHACIQILIWGYVYVYIYIYYYIHVHIHIYIFLYVYTQTYVYVIHIRICKYISRHICMCVCICMLMCLMSICLCLSIHIRRFVYGRYICVTPMRMCLYVSNVSTLEGPCVSRSFTGLFLSEKRRTSW